MTSLDATLMQYYGRPDLSRADVFALLACIDQHYVEPRGVPVRALFTPREPKKEAPQDTWWIQKTKVIPKRSWVTLDRDITSLKELITFIDAHPLHCKGENDDDDDDNVEDSSHDAMYWIRSATEGEGTSFMQEMQALHQIYPELVQIQAMIGLGDLKRDLLDQILYFVQQLHVSNGDGVGGDYKHTILIGAPGTGKTELAQLIGTMYAKMGVLKNKVFRKVTRSDLVAGYLGQTAIKTQTVIDECLGGCLFIDEVYALGPKKDSHDMFSKECIDTLCEAMSNHREQLMVIVAGYEDEVKEQFLDANKGLESRFVWRFTLNTYSVEELKAIFLKKASDGGWGVADDVPSVAWLEKRRDQFTRNGRDMETLFMYAKIAHGRRTFGRHVCKRRTLNQTDIDAAYVTFKQHRGDTSTPASLPFGLYT